MFDSNRGHAPAVDEFTVNLDIFIAGVVLTTYVSSRIRRIDVITTIDQLAAGNNDRQSFKRACLQTETQRVDGYQLFHISHSDIQSLFGAKYSFFRNDPTKFRLVTTLYPIEEIDDAVVLDLIQCSGLSFNLE